MNSYYEINIDEPIKDGICFSKDVVLFIQRWQLALAKVEMEFAINILDAEKSESSNMPFDFEIIDNNEKRRSFYEGIYSLLSLDEGNPVPVRSIHYYTIHKTASTFTRAALTSFSHSNTSLSFQYVPWKSRYSHSADESNFAFTFVRDPFNRFLSGYNQVEFYLTNMGVNLTHKFPLRSAVGSVQRAKEFINMLVAAEGCVEAMAFHVNVSEGKRLFESAELMHVSPMIGTLLMAQDIEQKPLRLYRFENLDAEWKRLERESRLVGLYKAKAATTPKHHKSTQKPFSNKARRAMQSLFSDTRDGTEGYFYI